MSLTEKQLQYGFYYYFPEERQTKTVVEVSEYDGEKELVIACTQLGNGYKPKDKKRILNEWIKFLIDKPNAFTKLNFCTRVPQELFDAICYQSNLVDLHIKWGAYADLSAIKNLKKLKFLYLGSGASVESISPISCLSSLKGLYVENFKKVNNYDALQVLTELESLTICGDGTSPQYIKVDNIEFLKEMRQLKFFSFLTVRLSSGDYSAVLSLKNLEFLSLRSHRDVKKIYDQLIQLPKLKWGLLKDRPENYQI